MREDVIVQTFKSRKNIKSMCLPIPPYNGLDSGHKRNKIAKGIKR